MIYFKVKQAVRKIISSIVLKRTNNKPVHCQEEVSSTNSINIENIDNKSHHKIRIVGENNLIEVQNNTLLNVDIRIRGHNNKLIIGSDSSIKGIICIKGNNLSVLIGNHTSFGDVYILCQENSNVEIGSYCMFSRNIEIRTTDAHAVIDIKTGKRLNPAQSIIIGDHVWVSLGVLINKGAMIPDDCIVGAGAFINKPFTESNTILAGMPAKIVRRSVTWNRTRRKFYNPKELFDWEKHAIDNH